MFHVGAYTTSYTAASTLTQLVAAPDIVLQTRDNALVCNKVNLPGAFWGIGATVTRLQMQAPSLRGVAQLEVQPVMQAMPGAGSAAGGLFVDAHPYQLTDGEELACYVAHSSASAERDYGFVRLHDSIPQPVPPSTKIYTVRITGTTTLVANSWSNVPLTFDQNLPKGKFQCVGARFNSAGAYAFRFYAQAIQFRPGGVAQQSDLALDVDVQRRGKLGVWFEFDYLSPPTVDVFSTSADTSEEGVIDLVYLG